MVSKRQNPSCESILTCRSLASHSTSEMEIEKRSWMPVPASCSKRERRINICLMRFIRRSTRALMSARPVIVPAHSGRAAKRACTVLLKLHKPTPLTCCLLRQWWFSLCRKFPPMLRPTALCCCSTHERSAPKSLYRPNSLIALLSALT